MKLNRILIANRGEIVVRVARTATQMGIETVAVFAEDDQDSPHGRQSQFSEVLRGVGAKAYLDIEQLISVALATDCDGIHPGYGFLSENADFAAHCNKAGLTFIGPRPELLELFGDKTKARTLAAECGVPVMRGTGGPTTLADAREFMDALDQGQAVMVKAVAGGGGRGTREVHSVDELADAFERCSSEALTAFGNGDLYLEQIMAPARHIEVQILGDGTGSVRHLGERDCSLQRRNQKLIEISPAPNLSDRLRQQLIDHAMTMAAEIKFDSVGTFEFLVDTGRLHDETSIAFMEANPRLQVEHTVTEEVWGVDLVELQIAIASGTQVDSLQLPERSNPMPNGFAIEARVTAETLLADGTSLPGSGRVESMSFAGGRGVRIDHAIQRGYRPNPRYDPLLAKLVVHSPNSNFESTLRSTQHALAETTIAGIGTNIGLLRAIVSKLLHDADSLDTKFVDRNRAELLHLAEDFDQEHAEAAPENAADPGTVDFDYSSLSIGDSVIESPIGGVVVRVDAAVGASIGAGQPLVIIESMKMEHVVSASNPGSVLAVLVEVGSVIDSGAPVLVFKATEGAEAETASDRIVDLDSVRSDLARVMERHALGMDANRGDVVAKRHGLGRRTARENVDDLCDADSFVEYGPLTIAAQRARRSHQELITRTPADGLVGGIGAVNGERCVVASYDYTVLAGTQGYHNHRKKDRLFDIAEREQFPVVLFAEGGGGRPGDTDYAIASGLDVTTFSTFSRLSGLVPLVGITGGRCFAGNAALLGVCDVIIATEDSNIGMGGPVMIEGGGLGAFAPEDVGPIDVQTVNGVVDIRVADDEAAVATAKKYIAYFQGTNPEWEAPDARGLRHIIPENRKRIYDVREVIEGIADVDSVLELRSEFAQGMITSLIRIEGKPYGLVANNPMHLGGAIDTPGADKASRFMQLCDAFALPLVFLCDTPGFMVGPESEKTATVRHFARMFVAGASLRVPFGTIVLRKAYGLGAQSMAGGGFKAPLFTVAWPSGEFGPMGIEGAVHLAHRREMAAIEDPVERQKYFDDEVAEMYERGSALSVAEQFEFDDVIDPMDSRRWITTLLTGGRSNERRRPNIDTW